ncbi:MAG TPA: carbamoyltransferase HypF [Verrucomicrobiae bacterium]
MISYSGSAEPSHIVRLRLTIRGAVQGVGFRPFVFRLAEDLKLNGWVRNSSQGVFLEVEGPQPILQDFLLRLESEKPPRSSIQSLESSWLDPVGYRGFEIRESDSAGSKTTLVLPDIATCPDCLREIFEPANRRYWYPFTNCTNCGPRFSIIEALPYDRPNTSMKKFRMCAECQAEYEDPRDRRFHAQPNACPVCGPQVELRDREGKECVPAGPTGSGRVLEAAAEAVRSGKIVAVKGLGGFHLVVTAGDDKAVRRLRERKHREEKPLALMFPSLDMVKAVCDVSPHEERLLRSPEAPIVLLRQAGARRAAPAIAAAIAPRNPYLGVMLPYTPLHHLLLAQLRLPVVATSGNLSDEPICIDEREAVERLGGIADLFLVHNRPIVRQMDDSIVRVMAGRELVLRRARGFAPLPIQKVTPQTVGDAEPALPACDRSVLAVGAHLKNAIALSVGPQVFISQHIGDLETEQAHEAFRRVIADLQRLYEVSPGIVAADAHPDYLSTKFARQLCSSSTVDPSHSPILYPVQHHVAHALSCMVENDLTPPVLGVSWDGTGYGTDGTIWGGEFFHVTASGYERVAHLRPFRLPGGDKAVKQPCRTALGILFELHGEAAFALTDLPPIAGFSRPEVATLKAMLRRRINSPLTSSTGRLFDAVASLAGLRQRVRFEGQAAMELEFSLDETRSDESYPITIAEPPAANSKSQIPNLRSPLLIDWGGLIEAVVADVRGAVGPGRISLKFHNALVEGIVEVARRTGEKRVVLSGGCFQNRYLTETAVKRLREEGFLPYWHQRVPPNDGGIALGQVAAAFRQTSLALVGV